MILKHGIRYIVHKDIFLGRLTISIRWRAKDNFMGRFGGGWNWSFGFEAGEHDLILNLLVLMIHLYWRKPK